MWKKGCNSKVKMIFVIIIFNSLAGFSQKESFEYLSTQDYELINDIFGESIKGKKYIYERTYFDKSWKRYFENTDLIYANVGLPTLVSDSTLKTILTKEVLDEFRNGIIISIPLKLKKSRLKGNIVLTDSYDTKQAIENRVRRISNPIIYGDIGVIRMLTINEAPIFIVQRKNDKWEIIYTFNDWLILE